MLGMKEMNSLLLWKKQSTGEITFKINTLETKQFIFVHGHLHVPRFESIENLTILCQGATGLPFDEDQRGAIGFLQLEIHLNGMLLDLNIIKNLQLIY